MDAELMSRDSATKSGSFIAETTSDVVHRRGEEILGLPVVKGKTWNVTAIITPAEAKAILLAMPVQRPIAPSNVAYFRSVIAAGRFRVTHQGIAFDQNGHLLDGQHRLTGCVEADAAIEVQVTFNMDKTLFDSLDRGRNRTSADDLIVSAIVSTKHDGFLLAAAAKILWHLDNGRVPWTSVLRGEFTVTEMRETIERHPFVHDAVAYCAEYQRQFRGIGPGLASAFYVRFHEVNAEKAETFMSELVHGENPRFGDPVYALREYRRWADSAKKKAARQKMMIIIVRCWNAYVEGRQLMKVASGMRHGAESNFPEISRGK